MHVHVFVLCMHALDTTYAYAIVQCVSVMYLVTCVCMHVCMHVCTQVMYLFVYVCFHACMYLCMYVCMYARMHL